MGNISNMRILNISSNDYANMSHNNSRALRSIGVTCDDVTLNKHIFNYESQSEVVTREEVVHMISKYDVIQIFHTCPIMLKLAQLGKAKRLVVYHSGTRYRETPNDFNQIFNDVVDLCITDQTEFMQLGAKNIQYLAPHIDLLPTEKRKEGKLIVGHYPSNPIVKGTKEIREMLEPFKDDFEIRIDETILPHTDNLKRIAECHIYVELFKPELRGKPYGCFGVTAFEATALGCLVVTNNLHKEVYKDAYGKNSPFIIANTSEMFNIYLDTLKMDLKAFTELSNKYHTNFLEKHSIESTGKRILELIK